MKNLQKNLIYTAIVAGTLVVSYQFFHARQKAYIAVSSFKDCVDSGYQVTATYPEKCIAYGKTFINLSQKQSVSKNTIATQSSSTPVKDYKNQAYNIDGEQVYFKDGVGILPENVAIHRATTTLITMDNPFMEDVNSDGINDTTLLIRTVPIENKKSAYYLTTLLSLNGSMFGINTLFLDYSLISAAYVYKNGELQIGYTTTDATTTIKQKKFILENNILKQLTSIK